MFSSQVNRVLFLLRTPFRSSNSNGPQRARITEVNYAQNPRLSKYAGVSARAFNSALVLNQRLPADAELTQQATGVQFHKLLTPGQLVDDLKTIKGVERVGEGPMDGRSAEKYRYSASTNTNTKAGEVKAEAFVYVDKETGLPLRAEMLAESSGDVKGVNAARVVAEMRDIKTDIE